MEAFLPKLSGLPNKYSSCIGTYISYIRMSWWIQKVIPGELQDVYQMWQQPGWMRRQMQKLESGAEPASGPHA